MYWGLVTYLNTLAQTNIVTATTTAIAGSLLFWAILIFIITYYLFPAFAETGTQRYHVLRTCFRRAAAALLPALVVLIIARIIQITFPLPRPFVALESIPVPFSLSDTGSFPADQIAFLTTLAYMAFYNRKWLGWIVIGATALTATGQLAAGVHWPIDIVVGILLGILVGYGSRFMLKSYIPELLQ